MDTTTDKFKLDALYRLLDKEVKINYNSTVVVSGKLERLPHLMTIEDTMIYNVIVDEFITIKINVSDIFSIDLKDNIIYVK